MEISAILKNAPLSAQKARLVGDQIRGMPVEKALNLLKFSSKKAAAIIRGKSPIAIFSFGPKKETNQNKITAPPTRMAINPKGSTYFGITSLAMVNVTP